MTASGEPDDTDSGDRGPSESDPSSSRRPDPEEIEQAAREMGYAPEKSGQEYLTHLREETNVNVIGALELVPECLDPGSNSSFVTGDGRHMLTAVHLPTELFPKPLDPDDDWPQHIAVLVHYLGYILPDTDVRDSLPLS